MKIAIPGAGPVGLTMDSQGIYEGDIDLRGLHESTSQRALNKAVLLDHFPKAAQAATRQNKLSMKNTGFSFKNRFE